jgi:hypothetical protein
VVAGEAVSRREPPLFLPLLASIVACALLSGLWLVSMGGPREGFLLGCIIGGVVGTFHALMLGVPCAYLLRRSARFDAWHMAPGGFFIGGLPLGLLLDPWMGLQTGIIGMQSALAFLAAYRGLRRPG